MLFLLGDGEKLLYMTFAVEVTKISAFVACRLLDRSHSDWREMVPHSGFDLHFSDNE